MIKGHSVIIHKIYLKELIILKIYFASVLIKIWNIFAGCFYGEAIGYAGQAVPALLDKIGTGSTLTKPLVDSSKMSKPLKTVFSGIEHAG